MDPLRPMENEQKQMIELSSSAVEPSDRDPKIVTFALSVQRLKAIDVIGQRFQAEGYINLGWQSTKEEYAEYKDCTDTQFRSNFDPNKLFKCLNGDVTIEVRDCRVVMIGDRDFFAARITKAQFDYTFISVLAYHGDFAEHFELKNFPFECQDLHIHMKLQQNTKISVFLPKHGAGHEGYYDRAFEVVLDPKSIDEYEYGGAFGTCLTTSSTLKYSTICYSIKLLRKWQIYFWRIVLVMFITTLCSLLVFTMDIHQDIGDIYGLLITLLLTATAFQFVVSSYVPNLSYQTLLDIYVTSSFVIIFVVILEIVVISASDLNEEQYRIAGVLSFVALVITQIAFLIKFISARSKEREKVKMDYFDMQSHGKGMTRIREECFITDFRYNQVISKIYKRKGVERSDMKVYTG